MDFWKVIEASCDRPLSVVAAAQRLEASLREMPLADVEAFCGAFDRAMDDAYTWELWGVAYLVNGGCGDDSFMDFRSSLIALGEDTFKAALSDAESLLALPSEELAELCEEGMLYCGATALESLGGVKAQRAPGMKTEPSGTPWDETRESLAARFPRAWSEYGWEDSGAAENTQTTRSPWWKFW